MNSTSTIEKHMQAMAEGFQAQKAGDLNVIYQFRLTGEDEGTWTVSVANGKCNVDQGAVSHADTTITMSTDQYLKLAVGELNAIDAYREGHVKVDGNLDYARKFMELFPPWASRVAPDEPPVPFPTPPTPEPVPAEPTLADFVRAMPEGFLPDKADGLQAIYRFQLTGDDGGTWTVTVANQSCTVAEGEFGSPSVTIHMSGADFIKLAQGKLDTRRAYGQGKIRVSGDLNLATRIPDIFEPWAADVEVPPQPTPTPTPTHPEPAPEPAPTPEPTPSPPVAGPVNPTLLNGSFDDYQPYVRDGEAKFWKEPQFPERYGVHWTLVLISEGKRRFHPMDSEIFGKFTQKYFGGGGRDYHIHGRHSQVITSRYGFDLILMQTVAAQPGREYAFSGSIVSFYQGTSGPPVHDKVFKTLGIDPTGGRDYSSPTVVWGERDGRDNEWRYPVMRTTAQAKAITVFIRLENTERDVGETELNIIHLDDFKLES